MMKKGILYIFVRSGISLYEGAKARFRLDFFSDEFEVKVEIHQRYLLSPFYFANVVDVVTEFTRNEVLSELLYAVNLVLMTEII